MFPMTRDSAIAAGYAELLKIANAKQALTDDPTYFPVCDFMERWSRMERRILSRILRQAERTDDKAAAEYCRIRLEEWMP